MTDSVRFTAPGKNALRKVHSTECIVQSTLPRVNPCAQ